MVELTRDVIGSSLALSFDENRHVSRILAIPSIEWLKNLEAVRLR